MTSTTGGGSTPILRMFEAGTVLECSEVVVAVGGFDSPPVRKIERTEGNRMGKSPNRSRKWAERFIYVVLAVIVVMTVVGAATGSG